MRSSPLASRSAKAASGSVKAAGIAADVELSTVVDWLPPHAVKRTAPTNATRAITARLGSFVMERRLHPSRR
jgi:hypothetical protein